MLLIGLTGGIASGKSFVSHCFEEHGAPVIDADQLAREVVKPGSKGLHALTGYFGRTILTPEGELDRAGLRRIVFANPADREFLDRTLHPLIRKLSVQLIDEASKAGYSYLVYAVPLLLETGQEKRFDRIAVVDVPESMQLERLMSRDGGDAEQARNIIASQATRKQRLAIADDVIDNSGEMPTTEKRVSQLHELYLQLHTLNQAR